jgi:uncharacterized protein YehS (DUF1456 family)
MISNNDVLRRLRYTFDFNDDRMIELFGLSDYEVTRSEVSNWLKKADDPGAQELLDIQLAVFLNGLIVAGRGKKEGPQVRPEIELNNNLIFKKLKIALNLRDEDILAILALVDMRISKHELSAFFRNPNQSQYRPCQDQILRNFLHGLQLKYRDNPTP